MIFNKTTILAATSAIALIAAAPASAAGDKGTTATNAQNTPTSATEANAASRIKADDLVGKDLRNATGDQIGDIESIIIDDNGEVAAVVVGVGGFLGIGERSVAINWNQVDLGPDGRTITTRMTRNDLEALPEYQYRSEENRGRAFVDRNYLDQRADMREQREETMDRKGQSAAQRDQRPGQQARGPQQRSQTQAGAAAQANWVAAEGSLRASNLIGASVVNDNDETIGEVDDVIFADGSQRLVLSVGEFLGMGGHRVAVDMDQAEIRQQQADQNDLRVKLNMTEEQLKALPKYGTNEPEDTGARDTNRNR